MYALLNDRKGWVTKWYLIFMRHLGNKCSWYNKYTEDTKYPGYTLHKYYLWGFNSITYWWPRGLLNFHTTDTLGQMILCPGEYLICCSVFSSIPGLSLLGAKRITQTHQSWSSRISPDIANIDSGVKLLWLTSTADTISVPCFLCPKNTNRIHDCSES